MTVDPLYSMKHLYAMQCVIVTLPFNNREVFSEKCRFMVSLELVSRKGSIWSHLVQRAVAMQAVNVPTSTLDGAILWVYC